MPNYSVRNCFNQNDIQVIFWGKGTLTPNQVITVSPNNGIDIYCCSVIGETLDPETIQAWGGIWDECITCYASIGLFFEFVDCKIDGGPNYYISPSNFVTLPTLNKIYYMALDDGPELCYQFIGTANSEIVPFPSTITSEITEYNLCQDCVVKPSFGELYNERVNDGNFLQKTNDFKNNYSNYINERQGQQPK